MTLHCYRLCAPVSAHYTLSTVYELAPQPHISSSPQCRGGHNNSDVFMRSELTELWSYGEWGHVAG